jgi:hypothetical protein
MVARFPGLPKAGEVRPKGFGCKRAEFHLLFTSLWDKKFIFSTLPEMAFLGLVHR